MDEWEDSYEKEKLNSLIETHQLEVDFLTAMKESRIFIERHQATEVVDYEACIRVSELYGVPFDDRWGFKRHIQRRYFPAKFFEKYPDEMTRSGLIGILQDELNWTRFTQQPTESGWFESQYCF